MAFVNYSTREINVKIVYYGPGLCGKTANLQYLYSRAPSQTRGRLISLATETERTLFFDFLPMNLGVLHGFRVRFHLYTVPGQVFYEASRKLILKGVDGLLFVADSDPLRLDANQESWEGLQRNLTGYGLSMPPLPAVIQYNKRDLPGALPLAELHAALGNPDLPQFEGIATDGTGVFESLKGLARGVLNQLQHESFRTDRSGFAPERPAADAAAAPPPTEPAETPSPSSNGTARTQVPDAGRRQPPADPTPAPRPETSPAAVGRASRPVGTGTMAAPRPPAAPSAPVSVQRPAANPQPEVPQPGPTASAGIGGVSRVDRPRSTAQDPASLGPTQPADPPSVNSGPTPVKRRGFGWFRRSR